MGEPWGLTGADFLTLYSGLLIICVTGVMARRRRVLEHYQLTSGPQRQLDVYELAYLAGGPARVVDTAASALVAEGRLRARRDGRLARVSGAGGGYGHDVERLVHDNLLPHTATSLQRVRERAVADPRMVAIRDRLRRDGLLVTEHQITQVRRPVLALGIPLTLGIVRLVNAARLGYPVTQLAVVLSLTVLLAALLWWPPHYTEHGRDLLRRLREAGPAERAPRAVALPGGGGPGGGRSGGPGGAAGVGPGFEVAAVALFGAAAITEAGLRGALFPAGRKPDTGGDGGGNGSGADGVCGGDGGCGGACGGCGGCGG
ncbi:TIGR04222 domain-containing membrane protein [Allostreptomyces psammosilenae]|uniref:Uncharacterized protein (TIGR04222 family) n=1 Tax=Allostreptomyces psammosilenae TaxID=1892865 RepID=A0A853A4Z2_9ACTN|nr:TIGR04222 domain-containing membrane protein [Allostreptomyces psammosilenae]NYI07944.1 uncharacterized protein (TIGR04222 family) [Allostreptomyces psammosilenae]